VFEFVLSEEFQKLVPKDSSQPSPAQLVKNYDWEVVARAPRGDSATRKVWICPPKVNLLPPGLPPTETFFPPVSVPATAIGGLDVGTFAEVSRFQSTFIEFFAPTGEEESRNSFGKTGITVGGHVGFVIPWMAHAPAASNAPAVGPVLIEPFVDFEDPNNTTKFPFFNGSFISVQRNFEATFGVNAGPSFVIDPASGRTLWLYGTLGVSVENQKFTINFIPMSSSESKTVTGLTVGFGGALTLPGVQLFGMPVALTGEYRHTFWQAANFNMPAASTTSNFRFEGDDDKIMFGAKLFIFGGFGGPQPIRLPATR
jgi:hypothetical protein